MRKVIICTTTRVRWSEKLKLADDFSRYHSFPLKASFQRGKHFAAFAMDELGQL